MTWLVVDSSVAAKWFIVEPYSAEARHILGQYASGGVSLLAPDLIYAEFGNIIWKKQLFQALDATDAQEIIAYFRRLDLTLTSTADLLEDAYRLAVLHRRTVYDMIYLALSLRVACQCVTADEKLCNAIGAAFPSLVWLGNWL